MSYRDIFGVTFLISGGISEHIYIRHDPSLGQGVTVVLLYLVAAVLLVGIKEWQRGNK